MRTAEQFWANVDKSGTCWLWTAGRSVNGYGRVVWDGRSQQAHRIAYELTFGPLPRDTSRGARGTLVCHKCDVRLCCRPEHLWRGTQADNVADAVSKKRMRSGRFRGDGGSAKLTAEQVTEIRARYPLLVAEAEASCRRGHPRDVNARLTASGRTACRACDTERMRHFRTGAPIAPKRPTPQQALAAEYGVDHGTIWMVVHGLTW